MLRPLSVNLQDVLYNVTHNAHHQLSNLICISTYARSAPERRRQNCPSCNKSVGSLEASHSAKNGWRAQVSCDTITTTMLMMMMMMMMMMIFRNLSGVVRPTNLLTNNLRSRAIVAAVHGSHSQKILHLQVQLRFDIVNSKTTFVIHGLSKIEKIYIYFLNILIERFLSILEMTYFLWTVFYILATGKMQFRSMCIRLIFLFHSISERNFIDIHFFLRTFIFTCRLRL